MRKKDKEKEVDLNTLHELVLKGDSEDGIPEELVDELCEKIKVIMGEESFSKFSKGIDGFDMRGNHFTFDAEKTWKEMLEVAKLV